MLRARSASKHMPLSMLCHLSQDYYVVQTADPAKPPVVMEELGERKRRRTDGGNADRNAVSAGSSREPSPGSATRANAAPAKPAPAGDGHATTGLQRSESAAAADQKAPTAAVRDTGAAGGSDEESEERLFCLCQQPYSPEQAMVSCDACGEWWHLRCVGISQAHARSAKVYHCPFCRSLRVRASPAWRKCSYGYASPPAYHFVVWHACLH